MTDHLTNDEGIDFQIILSGTYEHYDISEILMKDPDGVVWSFDNNDGLLKDIISDDDVEQVAYENAYEMEMNWRIDQADRLYDAWKERDLN